MRSIQILNRLLWGLNGLLGAGILAFAWSFLLFPKDAHSLKGYPWDDEALRLPPRDESGDDSILKSLRNPLKKEIPEAPAAQTSPFKAVLLGTLPSEKDPANGIAFIKSTAKNVELIAFVGEEIRSIDRPFEDFRGWKLVEVWKGQATFSDGREKVILTFKFDTSSPAGAPGAPITLGASARPLSTGQPYQSANFKSQLLSQTENRHVWGLDPDEIEWVLENQEAIMAQAFQVSPSAAGGIRIDSVQAGSIGAARGLIGGDIIKEVNGQPLSSVADAKTLMTSPAMRPQTGMRITVERAGKAVAIEYRPLPR